MRVIEMLCGMAWPMSARRNVSAHQRKPNSVGIREGYCHFSANAQRTIDTIGPMMNRTSVTMMIAPIPSRRSQRSPPLRRGCVTRTRVSGSTAVLSILLVAFLPAGDGSNINIAGNRCYQKGDDRLRLCLQGRVNLIVSAFHEYPHHFWLGGAEQIGDRVAAEDTQK